ncbi:ClpP-like prohead protease/major capsid protein fusion protein [Methylobacterium sp. SI9]|uniref:ClpP-like prohead protease/major capsid protein fusion protein n=1 Tax=Methylobacterium guangdongense TaxID=3138811 RepID=UPI00313B0A51
MDGTRSLVSNGELILYGVINPNDMSGEGIRAIDVIDSLVQLSAAPQVKVRINSPGGSCIEGLAIYNALRGCGKPVVTQVDGIAASAASVVMLAGDTRLIAESASVMIHDPWGMAIGTSDELRASADECDRQKQIVIDLYVARTGQDAETISAMMAAETYMSASDAIDNGFATALAPEMRVAACAKLNPESMAKLLLAKPSVRAEAPAQAAPAATPAAPAAQSKEPPMTQSAASGATGGHASAAPAHQSAPATPPATPAPGATPPHVPTPGESVAMRLQAAQEERERVQGIHQAVRSARLGTDLADMLIAQGVQLSDARTTILDKWSEARSKEEGFGTSVEMRGHISVEKDAEERWAEGATQGLMMRAGLTRPDRSNEFYGLTLSELARSSLHIRNQKTGNLDRMTMVGRAFTVRSEGPGYNSTSDFPSILQNVAYKAMMKGYTEVEETFEQWTGKGVLTDFRPAYRVDSGLFPSLDKVEEGAEYKYGTVTDNGTMVVLATYGKLFAITRQAIINDDLHYFNQIPLKMGRAAKRTIGNLVYAILNTNPAMQDGAPLFSAGHGNLAAAGGLPSASAIGAARSAMARQKDDAGIGTGVGIRPKFILTSPELFDITTTVLKAEYLTSDAGLQPNYVQNAATPIWDGRISAGPWFLAADPAVTDTIEVDYLDGVEEPFMDEKQGWSVDGVEYKVRIDAGVKALHWRGLYKNGGVGN